MSDVLRGLESLAKGGPASDVELPYQASRVIYFSTSKASLEARRLKCRTSVVGKQSHLLSFDVDSLRQGRASVRRQTSIPGKRNTVLGEMVEGQRDILLLTVDFRRRKVEIPDLSSSKAFSWFGPRTLLQQSLQFRLRSPWLYSYVCKSEFLIERRSNGYDTILTITILCDPPAGKCSWRLRRVVCRVVARGKCVGAVRRIVGVESLHVEPAVWPERELQHKLSDDHDTRRAVAGVA